MSYLSYLIRTKNYSGILTLISIIVFFILLILFGVGGLILFTIGLLASVAVICTIVNVDDMIRSTIKNYKKWKDNQIGEK